MGLSREKFVELRPCLFHITFAENLEQIRSMGELFSASTWLAESGLPLDEPRHRHREIVTPRGRVTLADQGRLFSGSFAVRAGQSLSSYVKALNDRVYFWPGSRSGPSSRVKQQFRQRTGEQLKALVIQTASALRCNAWNAAEFTVFNSGYPAINQATQPRGEGMFRQAFEFIGTPSAVVEVAWKSRFVLPGDAKVVEVSSWL